ncbi:hypothetical protein BaRGS_00016407 [Batillaria attramentaria]|uniref:Mutator-like transposase domain-containing protein n=1 Tax=Batillaria attramentaria TaxID=370345 RepID=A0ABD0KZN4_9CAEN
MGAASSACCSPHAYLFSVETECNSTNTVWSDLSTRFVWFIFRNCQSENGVMVDAKELLACCLWGVLGVGRCPQSGPQRTGIIYTGFDINRYIVAAAVSNGIGYIQLQRFFAVMNMPPPMNEKTWYHYQKRMHCSANVHLQEAAEIVRQTYLEMKIHQPDQNGVFNVLVLFDGSWQKRGRTHNGVATVIEIFSNGTSIAVMCVILATDTGLTNSTLGTAMTIQVPQHNFKTKI